MSPSWFRCLVKQTWEKDPWFTRQEAAAYLGLKVGEAISRYIKWGILKAERRPGAGGLGQFVIFKSVLDKFKKSGDRDRHFFDKMSGNRKKRHLKEGKPVQVMMVWKIRCPKCKHLVRINAGPRHHGPNIKKMFTEMFAGDKCAHGRTVRIE